MRLQIEELHVCDLCRDSFNKPDAIINLILADEQNTRSFACTAVPFQVVNLTSSSNRSGVELPILSWIKLHNER